MRIKNILALSVFFIFSFFLSGFFSGVGAQQKSERWVCLVAAKEGSHTASLSVNPGAKLIPNTDTYVFECLTDTLCTSGNSTIDNQVFAKNSLAELGTQLGYRFQGSTLPSNPLKSDAGGNISPFTWTSSTPKGHARRWLALNYFDPVGDPALIGEAASQQQATLSFETVVKSDCISLSWDPYGRVFDSATLEPVKGATVTLSMKRDDGLFTTMTSADLLGGNLQNPQVTAEDGGFSFVVPDATYKLTTSSPNYTFPEEITNINPNYMKIYSDIYPAATGEEIIQQGGIQHRDIPLGPIGTSVKNDAKLMEYFYDLDKITSTIYVRGRVSHPFAIIHAYSLKTDPNIQQMSRYRLLTDSNNPVVADKIGNFTLKIKQANFEQDEVFGEIEVEKTDLTQANLGAKVWQWFLSLVKEVKAQESSSVTRFEPILNYLEGYAYDDNGQLLPNAKVSVVLKFSNRPSYETQTNEEGYYKISSENLPSMSYRIIYTTSGGETVISRPSKFVAQNSETITDNNVKLNQYVNEQGEDVTAEEEVPVDDSGIAGNTENDQFKTRNPKNLYVVLMIVVFIIVFVAGVMIVRHLRQPN